MLTSDFDYMLPPELIAQVPAPERSASRMLVVDRRAGTFAHRGIRDLGDYLRPKDVLVLNDTRVIPARLLGARSDTGGQVEVFLLESRGDGKWLALYRCSGRRREGQQLTLANGHIAGTILRVREDGRIDVALQARAGSLEEALEAHGIVPVPPYIHREAGDQHRPLDRERYQTVYARSPGAVAAPTAGLHFTPELLEALQRQCINVATLTLHVGLGTFKPVKADRLKDHIMEAERYEISPQAAATVREAKAAGGRVVAVGSTSVRTLETVARDAGDIRDASGSSTLFIHPPYTFRAVDMMLTNFHLPRSTLLMMISAFADPGGADGLALIRRAYAEAIAARYRFYSYGDCMLLI